MKLNGFELRVVELPLVAPFRTSFGTETKREAIIIRAVSDEAEGWGESCAMRAPLYSSEYLEGSLEVMRRHLIPALGAAGDITGESVAHVLRPFSGHRMSKAGLEMAVLDAELRAEGRPLSRELGSVRDRVDCGVSVGIMDEIPQLLDAVDGYLAQGYVRIKLKIQPGWDVEPVRAVRERFGDDILLQVDANTAYRRGDAQHLAKLDPFDLLLIEQPLDEEDIIGNVELSRVVKTPICLDESIVSAHAAADAIRLGATSIINIKPGRVGGYLEARRIHDVCVANDIPVWCGGMLETGIGRAANLALAALPGFALPGDTSGSDRYYHRDITAPFVVENGSMSVPTGPGIGVDPVMDIMDELTTHKEWIPVG